MFRTWYAVSADDADAESSPFWRKNGLVETLYARGYVSPVPYSALLT